VAQNKAAWQVLTQFSKPFVTAFSDNDPLTRGAEVYFQNLVPGAQGQPHVTLRGAHFLQEDCPDDVVAVIKGVVARSGG
jgi:haloalkane dehalogenase